MTFIAPPTALEAGIRSRRPACQPPASSLGWPATPTTTDTDTSTATDPSTHTPSEAAAALPVHYQHSDNRLGVDFLVHRLPFEGLQALDPRLIRIPPGACNEKHRHAHESIFVVLEGEAEILVGTETVRLHRGGLAFAPRWIVHQSRNVSAEQELLLLAITDFGLTSSVLGDYDRQTRLRFEGKDSCHGAEPESEPESESESESNPVPVPDIPVTKTCTCRPR
jgi:quercetin dioxygenase-like cupin family protein